MLLFYFSSTLREPLYWSEDGKRMKKLDCCTLLMSSYLFYSKTGGRTLLLFKWSWHSTWLSRRGTSGSNRTKTPKKLKAQRWFRLFWLLQKEVTSVLYTNVPVSRICLVLSKQVPEHPCKRGPGMSTTAPSVVKSRKMG